MKPDTFSEWRSLRRVWAVGAAHGDVGALRALHDGLERRFRRGDRLVYLGNLLGLGGNPAAAIDEVLSFRRILLSAPGMQTDDIVYLRGVQEEIWQKLRELQYATGPAEVLVWMLQQGAGATLAAYGFSEAEARQAARAPATVLARWTMAVNDAVRARPGHTEFYAALRRCAFDAERRLLFVHAGLAPDRPLDAQKDAFWWNADALDRLAEPYAGFRRVVRGGREAREEEADGAPVLTVAGGCGLGGELKALCVDLDGAVVDRLAVPQVWQDPRTI